MTSYLGQVRQRSGGAEVGVAEAGDSVAEAVSEGHEEAVVGDVAHVQGSTHFEVEPVADEDEWDVFEGVRIALAEFVGPND